jgi:DNA-binding IclR family transcriptional regulator
MTDSPSTGTSDRRSVIRRAFEILDCFDGSAEMTVAGIVERTGMPPATVHRILASLVEWGGVERTSYGRYRLGDRIWQLGSEVPQLKRLRDMAQPFLVDLHLDTKGTVYLGVRNGTDGVYSDRITRVRSTKHSTLAARRLPLERTGGGRVLLAYSDDAWLGVLERAERDPVLKEQLGVLETRLARIREKKVEVSLNDGLPGRSSVAAPVFGANGGIVASIAVAFPATRIPDPWSIVPRVRATGKALTEELVRSGLG